MSTPLLKKVWSHHSLERAWRVIEENARTSKSDDVKKEIALFKEDSSTRLRSLCGKLSRGTFRFPPAKGVPIPKKGNDGRPDPKNFRPIVLADVESRIIQRSILEALLTVPKLATYVHTPYSFGGIRKKAEGDLAAVPAAIKMALDHIGSGANFVISADISKFFTRIPKSIVTPVIAQAVDDPQFMGLFEDAISVELSNIAELREKADAFPIYDIGVAQGNSLSPLLGNILLAEFDLEMNKGDCKCIRYIDDVLIFAPSKKAAGARFRLAEKHLKKFNMKFGAEKSLREPQSVLRPFEFLGIEFSNGLLRPAPKAQMRFLASIRGVLETGAKALRSRRAGVAIKKEQSLLAVLRRVDGMAQGWGKHYRFCNDGLVLEKIDQKISDLIRAYLGLYRSVAGPMSDAGKREVLGVELLAKIDRKPFSWPKGKRL
ncbi:MAG: RNA-dependent DNA polymerase [Proteobacteria bacterium]|nr:RNA-dependent DNA polymerase [Pseudomonadota bacterium]